MKRERLPIRTRVKVGLLSGVIFASGMAVFDYIDKQPFDIMEFLFYFIVYGLIFALIFPYKYTKDKK